MVLLQRQVADGVIENDGRRRRTFPRAREEKGEMNDEQEGNKVSGMIHHHVQIIFCVYRKEEKVPIRTFSTDYLIPKKLLNN